MTSRAVALSRRRLGQSLAGLAFTKLFSSSARASTTSAKLVVVGGGFGGATAARYLKRLLPSASVTLVEPNARYTACPFSNLVVTGLRNIQQQEFSYRALAAEGIVIARASATDVDPVAQQVTLSTGDTLDYDRLVLSPGIDFAWNLLEGYNRQAVQRMPHAWKAGAQTQLLNQQLQSMDDGGLVVISVTAAPFRCPPGPYERASLIAQYLQQHKPKSKLLVLDSNDKFSKQPLFLKAWQSQHSRIIEWRAASNDGRVIRVDPDALTLHTDFDDIHASVANIVPPQQAGQIAQRAGVTNESKWCPVNAMSFESRLQPNIHVIGDAIIAAPMPKSAFAANQQAKVCAIAVARLLTGLEVQGTRLTNTCYSFIGPSQAISVSGVYATGSSEFESVAGAGGTSSLDLDLLTQRQEAAQAQDWFSALTHEAFG